jgi:TRAP-type C4-dicarboxylate transport system permease small subunit
MEFSVLMDWMQYFLLIMGGCLVFFILMLFFSNRYTKNKLNQMEQNDKMNEIQPM